MRSLNSHRSIRSIRFWKEWTNIFLLVLGALGAVSLRAQSPSPTPTSSNLVVWTIPVATANSAALTSATPPDWKEAGTHQYAMVVYATVTDASGNALTNAGSLLSASEYGTLVGVTPLSQGPKGAIYQLKVGSDNWQSDLTYSFYDGGSDRVLTIGPGPGFVSGSMVGSIAEPVTLQESAP